MIILDWKDNVLMLIIANLLIYWRTFKYGLVSDDVPAYRKVAEVKPSTYWQRWYWDFRGVYNTKRCHVISILFHTLNCVLVYLAFKNIWAALLFMVNPYGLMGSVWVSGRAYSIVTTLALVSWLCPVWTIVLYGVAIYWNISALFYPLMFGFLGWHWSWLALLTIVGTWLRTKRDHFAVGKKDSKISNESNAELRALKPRKLILFVKTYGYYFRNVLFSYRLGLFHKFLYTYGLNKKENKIAYKIDGAFGIGLITLGLTGYGICFGEPLVQIGLAWFLINIAMWCNLVTFNQQIAERYCYLPMVGLMLVLGGTPLAPFFFVFYLTRLWWFMPSFLNEYWNVEYNIAEAKDLYYIWLSKGVHRFSEGNMHEAIRCLAQAQMMRPDDFKSNINLFYVALVVNDPTLAKKHLELAGQCVVEGKEEEIAMYVKMGKDLMERIEEGFKKEGKFIVDMKEIKLLL